MGRKSFANLYSLLQVKEESFEYVPLLRAFDKVTDRAADESGRISEELVLRLRSNIESLILKGVDYRAEFDKLDETSSGSLRKDIFKRVLFDK